MYNVSCMVLGLPVVFNNSASLGRFLSVLTVYLASTLAPHQRLRGPLPFMPHAPPHLLLCRKKHCFSFKTIDSMRMLVSYKYLAIMGGSSLGL
jgi:hypothetical protein